MISIVSQVAAAGAGAAALWLSLIVAGVLLVWLVMAFNGIVRHNNLVKEAWSGIDVQLERRHALVPNLVETVQGYAGFEKSLLEEITRLRGRAIDDRATRSLRDDENALTDRLRTLFALVENYPEIKANRSFLTLQEQLVEIEDQLQFARRYYNGTVRDYNIAVESFPTNGVAIVFGFRPAEFFEVETATVRANPKVEI